MRRKQHFAIKNGINNRGFSLLEVVVAMGIFSVGILAIAGLQVMATSGNAKARFSTEAAILAQDVSERLLSMDYDSASPIAAFQVGTNDWTDPPGGRYQVDYTVAASTLAGAINITVRVRWWAYGLPRRYNLTFIKTEAI